MKRQFGRLAVILLLLILLFGLLTVAGNNDNNEISGSLRLRGPLSDAGTGRVEVSLNGEWGTICDDGWDLNDARVVCRQLGYLDAVKALRGDLVPDGSGKIWLDDVDCTGREKSLTNCLHSRLGRHNCFHFEDAGVECRREEFSRKHVASTVVRRSPTKNGNMISVRSAYLRSRIRAKRPVVKPVPTLVQNKAWSRKHSSTTAFRDDPRPPPPTRPGAEAVPEKRRNRKSRFNWEIGFAAGAVVVILVLVWIYRYRRRQIMKRHNESVGSLSPNRETNDDCAISNQADHQPIISPPVDVNVFEEQRKPARCEIIKDLHSNSEEQSSLLKRRSATDTLCPDHGGIVQVDDITLNLAPGCLAEDKEITLIRDDHNSAFKALLDLGLVIGSPRVVELLPDGLKFLRPADLTISLENSFADPELFILHGSYSQDHQRVVWELVTSEIEEDKVNGVVNMKINGFCFYAFILAMRGVIARILSHLNHSFTSCAYAFYRRQPPMDKIDISVVLVSEFVDEYEENDIKQLKDHLKEGYVRSDKGMLKRVETNHLLQVSLDFPGVDINTQCILVKVDQPELDSVGYVIDLFKGSAIAKPASGTVNICEVDQHDERKFLWKLNIHEIEQDENEEEKAYVPSTESDPGTQVVYRTTKLTEVEIKRISTVYGVHWDELAGLMNIPYHEREKIRLNHVDVDLSLKAAKIFRLFNGTEDFDRHILARCMNELRLKSELSVFENENGSEEAPSPFEDLEQNRISGVETPVPPSPNEDLDQNGTGGMETPPTTIEDLKNGIEEMETSPSTPEINADENTKLKEIPLSPREMFRLSQQITTYWDPLAGEMGITSAERDDIRNNTIYTDHRSRAEKVLSIFNSSKTFSRKTLAKCLEGLKKFDLIRPIITGKWRNL